MLEASLDKNLEFAQRGLEALLEKRQFGPGRAHGDYVTFSCKAFSLSLVFYHADLWAEVYQNQYPESAVALANLLLFLSLPSNGREAPPTTGGPFASAWRLRRLSSIAADIDYNFDALATFFSAKDIESKLAAVSEFVVARNPDLFRRQGDH